MLHIRRDREGRLVDSETGSICHCHSDIWFEDGSIVLLAEETMFKVHISQLARHSLALRDMFDFPQPAESQCDTLSASSSSSTSPLASSPFNCPVLRLYDSAEDLGNLLSAIYDGPNWGSNDRDDFRVVSGVLRLATKYIIDPLRAKALAHLSLAWPSTLQAWDAREDAARAFELKTGAHPGFLYPSPIAIIDLARETDSPSLLCAAFYDLSRYPYSLSLEPNEDDPLYSEPSANSPQLTVSDLKRLALGKECASHSITSLIQGMRETRHVWRSPRQQNTHARNKSSTSSNSPVCISAAACRKDYSELVALATQHYLFDRERGCADPLYVAEELGQLDSTEVSECKACSRGLETWAARERQKIWKTIPQWFRLESDTI